MLQYSKSRFGLGCLFINETGSQYVVSAGFKLMVILLTQLQNYWNYKHMTIIFFRSFSSSQIELQYKCKFKNKYISPELLLYVTQECNREQLKNMSGFIKDDNFLYKYKIVYTQNFSTYLRRE